VKTPKRDHGRHFLKDVNLRFDFKAIKPAPQFSDVPLEKWANWIWQMQQSLTTEAEFSSVFDLKADEIDGFKHSGTLFKVSATPYYSSLGLSSDSIRRILMPTGVEAIPGAQHMADPLAEHTHSPTPRIIHRYSDRVLFLITDTCSVYCRFCTRKRFTGKEEGLADRKEYQEALEYIRSHKGIREVIFSGGDPLTLSNKVLGQALRDVREIEHIEIIRVGSRMPVVCPMRVDQELVGVLREYGPVYMMTHFSHPKELTKEAAVSLALLVDRGIPVFNQTVLLNGINNHPAIIQALSRRLLYLRVKPYYMFQCDPSEGTDHLRTTVESSENILKELWGHLSGLAMPTLSLDIPSGGGKTTLVPNFLEKSENGVREFNGWDGRKGIYKNPKVEQITPLDAEEYVPEWETLKNAKKKPSQK
jgi:lysine 2,3-aminomutase